MAFVPGDGDRHRQRVVQRLCYRVGDSLEEIREILVDQYLLSVEASLAELSTHAGIVRERYTEVATAVRKIRTGPSQSHDPSPGEPPELTTVDGCVRSNHDHAGPITVDGSCGTSGKAVPVNGEAAAIVALNEGSNIYRSNLVSKMDRWIRDIA